MRMICLVALLWINHTYAAPIEAVSNLAAESMRAVSEGRVYLLYVSRMACPYCTQLEQGVLSPMLKNDGYLPLVDLRELAWEAEKVVDFDQQVRGAAEIITRYKVMGTPTLLFLGVQGNELVSRITGYQSEDFYWYYFDEAFENVWIELEGR